MYTAIILSIFFTIEQNIFSYFTPGTVSFNYQFINFLFVKLSLI